MSKSDRQVFTEKYLARCNFDGRVPGDRICVAYSGGVDSTALLIAAAASGYTVTAFLINHQLRASAASDALAAEANARKLNVRFLSMTTSGVSPSANVEAWAREQRKRLLPDDVMTGHTADDQCETLLYRLGLGSGAAGVSGIKPGSTKPILNLRRTDNEKLCELWEIEPVIDDSNASSEFVRNRVRNELVPLFSDLMGRDIVPLTCRTANALREDDRELSRQACEQYTHNVKYLRTLPVPVLARVVREMLTVNGLPPTSKDVEQTFDVIFTSTPRAQLSRKLTVARTRGELRIEPSTLS